MKIERSCETGLYKNIWITQNYVSEVLFCSSGKDMLLNSTFPMLSFNALIGNFSPPFLFLSSFCITGSWWLNYVVTTIDSEYQFKLQIGDGGGGGGRGSKFLLASKIVSDRSLAWPPLSSAAVIHLASPLSHPTLSCTSICHSACPPHHPSFSFSPPLPRRPIGHLPHTEFPISDSYVDYA